VAKVLDASPVATRSQTLTGIVLGTPCYMSPEQARGLALDPRSDLYSVGVILYELLTGRPPFTDDTNLQVMAQHVKAKPVAPRQLVGGAVIPAEVERVVLDALAKDPTHRPQSAHEMIVQLSEAEAAAATISSGLRTALTSPWRALAPSTFGPRMRKSGSRTDETLRTRAWRANSASPPGFAGVGVLMFALVAAVWLVARVWH
jgi:serine/threonine-protein kinase